MKKIKHQPYGTETTCTFILILLWSYSAGSKIITYKVFTAQMTNQVFPKEIVPTLVYGVIGFQLLAICLLLFSKVQIWGFLLSFILMTMFTGYLTLVLLGAFNRVPCQCISVVPGMTFLNHLFFNLFFTAVAATGIFTIRKERRNKGMDRIESHAPLTS